MIALRGIAMRAGSFALSDVSLRVPDGCYAVLMGRTGSGKTSILEAICGLRGILAGSIEVNGQAIHDLDPAQRGVAYVPQDGALFETMSVRKQISMPMQIRGWARAEIEKRLREITELVGISHLINRRPTRLSGGERQRVALARAVGFRPRVLCLDEPFSALDEQTREEMYRVIETIRLVHPITALHVTHSSPEAHRLGDIVARIEDGRLTVEPRHALRPPDPHVECLAPKADSTPAARRMVDAGQR